MLSKYYMTQPLKCMAFLAPPFYVHENSGPQPLFFPGHPPPPCTLRPVSYHQVVKKKKKKKNEEENFENTITETLYPKMLSDLLSLSNY